MEPFIKYEALYKKLESNEINRDGFDVVISTYEPPERRAFMLWLALYEYGRKEIVGPEDNPEILKYYAEAGHSWVQDDETAWCSALMNYLAGLSGLEKTMSLMARSWLSVGQKVKEPTMGEDIVILWRMKKNSKYGHVGIYMGHRNGLVYILGGNQNNEVNITGYPEYQVLGYRKLKPV